MLMAARRRESAARGRLLSAIVLATLAAATEGAETLDGDLRAQRIEAHKAKQRPRLGRTASLTAEIAARRDHAKAGENSGFRSGRPRLRSDGPYFVHERAAADVAVAATAAAAADAAAKGRAFAANLFGAPGIGDGVTRVSNAAKDLGLAAPLARALKRGKLTVAFSGHSAAAGHGNMFNESFPFAFQRLLGPALAAAGVELRVGNFALGGTHSRPHPTFCAREVWGDDVDYVNWDFDMTEAGGQDRDGMLAFAAALGAAYDPPPVLVVKGGGVDDRARLAAKVLEPNSPVLRYDPRKLMTGPFAEAELDRNRKCVVALLAPSPARGGGCADGARFHSGSGGRCSSQVKWHPGWAVHEFHGAALALPWLKALEALLRDVAATGAKALDAVEKPKPWAPAPGFDFGDAGFLAAEVAGGLACATAYEPRAGRGVADLVKDASVLEAPRQRAAAGVEPDGCGQGPMDARGALLVAPDMGAVELALPGAKTPLATLLLCEPATGWNRARGMVPLDDGAKATWTLDGAPLTLAPLPRNSHLQRCYVATAPGGGAGGGGGGGGAVLAVAAKGGSHEHLRISQVIWSK